MKTTTPIRKLNTRKFISVKNQYTKKYKRRGKRNKTKKRKATKRRKTKRKRGGNLAIGSNAIVTKHNNNFIKLYSQGHIDEAIKDHNVYFYLKHKGLLSYTISGEGIYKIVEHTFANNLFTVYKPIDDNNSDAIQINGKTYIDDSDVFNSIVTDAINSGAINSGANDSINTSSMQPNHTTIQNNDIDFLKNDNFIGIKNKFNNYIQKISQSTHKDYLFGYTMKSAQEFGHIELTDFLATENIDIDIGENFLNKYEKMYEHLNQNYVLGCDLQPSRCFFIHPMLMNLCTLSILGNSEYNSKDTTARKIKIVKELLLNY